MMIVESITQGQGSGIKDLGIHLAMMPQNEFDWLGVIPADSSKWYFRGTGQVDINSWLTANSQSSISNGRIVTIPDNDSLNFQNWYAFEGSYGVTQLKNKAGLTVIENEDGSVVNEDGRYWVAVSPKVFNPDYPDNGKIWAGYDGLELGTELDIKIMNEKTGEMSYIYAIAGDIKAHTYDNGVVQTGQPYPNSWNARHEGYVDPGYDRSSIEFIRTSDSTNMNQYSIVEIMVKDKRSK